VPVGLHRALAQQAEPPEPAGPSQLPSDAEVRDRREVVEQPEVLVQRVDPRGARVEEKATGRPAKRISPPSSRWTPLIAFTSVDLPAPLSPSSATTSPSPTVSPAPSSARTAP
jgi:hypothetical protein